MVVVQGRALVGLLCDAVGVRFRFSHVYRVLCMVGSSRGSELSVLCVFWLAVPCRLGLSFGVSICFYFSLFIVFIVTA